MSSGGGTVGSDLSLNREQVEWLRDQLTVMLNETDSAYIAYADTASDAIPATVPEWQDRLVEGGTA
jgi:hypothetical protein